MAVDNDARPRARRRFSSEGRRLLRPLSGQHALTLESMSRTFDHGFGLPDERFDSSSGCVDRTPRNREIPLPL